MVIATRILVATDFSEPAQAAWTYGRELARALSATLHVLHVDADIVATGLLPPTYVPELGNAQQEILAASRARLADLVGDSPRPPVTMAAVLGHSPAKAILDYANEHDINLIVVGTHGRGAVAHLLLGSVAETIVRSASCPVLTVRHPQREFAVPDALQRASAHRSETTTLPFARPAST